MFGVRGKEQSEDTGESKQLLSPRRDQRLKFASLLNGLYIRGFIDSEHQYLTVRSYWL